MTVQGLLFANSCCQRTLKAASNSAGRTDFQHGNATGPIARVEDVGLGLVGVTGHRRECTLMSVYSTTNNRPKVVPIREWSDSDDRPDHIRNPGPRGYRSVATANYNGGRVDPCRTVDVDRCRYGSGHHRAQVFVRLYAIDV